MYASPYLHDDYAAGLEDAIVHTLFACVFSRARNDRVVYVDTHAAAGRYPLRHVQRARRETISRTFERVYRSTTLTQHGLKVLQNHLKLHNRGARQPYVYPGSPELARSLLKGRTESILSERNPRVHARLLNLARQHPNAIAMCEDGFEVARKIADAEITRSRHIVLIDPAYEATQGGETDYERLISTIGVLSRVPNTTVLATYPSATMADQRNRENMLEHLAKLGVPLAYADLSLRCRQLSLRGAGVLLVNGNPHFKFDAARALSELRSILALRGARVRTG